MSGIECEPGLYLEYATELDEWIDQGSGTRDSGRIWMWGIARCWGRIFPRTMRLLTGRIWNLHVEDIPGRKHYHLVPGEGTLDRAGLRAALEGIGYAGR